MEVDVLVALKELQWQAAPELSHVYVCKVCEQAIKEIERLREIEWMYDDLTH